MNIWTLIKIIRDTETFTDANEVMLILFLFCVFVGLFYLLIRGSRPAN